MRVGTWCAVVVAVVAACGSPRWAWGQESLSPPAPLLQAGLAEPPAPGVLLAREAAASRALDLGFPSIAAGIYAELVALPDLRPEQQSRLVLGWVVALLEDGRVTEAQAALAAYAGPRHVGYRLRVGLTAMAAGDAEAARAAAESIEPEQLAQTERPWYFYLQGLLADEQGDLAQANAAYGQAIETAASPLQRARFRLAELRAQQRVGPVTEAQARTLAQNVERFQGRPIGYDYAKQYAAVLAALDRPGEAVSFLQRQLVGLPRQERAVLDDFRLLLGMIAGAGEGAGRNALLNLLATGSDADKQRVALQLLARGLPEGPAAREHWRTELTRLIELDPPHPVLADLLLYRAQLALADNRYAEAEQDAQAVIERFPASPLRRPALGVLIGAAWERGRYRAAAGFATEARRLLEPGPTRAQLGVLVAEAFFRAGDYRSAADAYAAALGNVPPGVRAGQLMFQQVISHIRSGALDEAAARLDALADEPEFDVINRWQAEWNLARALQAAQRSVEASRRIDALTAAQGGRPAPPANLAVRLVWLQIRLAVDAGEPDRALALAPTLRDLAVQVDPALRAEVASSLALVEAEANFVLDRPEAALEVLRQLRETYPGTDAAVYSYIVEADAYSANNQLVEAQRLLTRLADDFPQNRYAPFALYQAALNAERRGQDNYLEDAIRLIERLVNTYPQSDLVFYARFKQGDLLRKLNQFGSAVQIYEQLVNHYSQHRDVFAAELARADCYAAQAVNDASQLESAITIYERLQVVPTAPAELRIEAGHKLGLSLLRRGAIERAQQAWWEVVNLFLLGPNRDAALGARGRHWLARTLLELARAFESGGRLEEARNAYELILQQELPGTTVAQGALSRLTGGGGVLEAGR